MRVVSVAFTGFNPLDLMDMDLDDLHWWYGQADLLIKEMKG